MFFIQDEMANMVWAIETVIQSATGNGKPGKEQANALINSRKKAEQRKEGEIDKQLIEQKLTYVDKTTVSAHWIPFIPVHKPNEHRQIQLQQRAMLDADKTKIEPRTSVLRSGLDQARPEAYFLNEEEIPCARINVSKSYKRTRWLNGEVYVWVGSKSKLAVVSGRANWLLISFRMSLKKAKKPD